MSTEPFDFFGEFLKSSPFPEGSPFRSIFVQFASWTAERHARLSAEFSKRIADAPEGTDFLDIQTDCACAFFDLWAEIVAVASTYEMLPFTLPALKEVERMMFSRATSVGLSWDAIHLQTLRFRMTQRKYHWTAECHRYARIAGERPSPPAVQPSTAESRDPETLPLTSKAEVRTRWEVIEPLLRERGWTRAMWATKAGVDPSVVYDYLDRASKPRADSRKVLAEALDIPLEQLPE